MLRDEVYDFNPGGMLHGPSIKERRVCVGLSRSLAAKMVDKRMGCQALYLQNKVMVDDIKRIEEMMDPLDHLRGDDPECHLEGHVPRTKRSELIREELVDCIISYGMLSEQREFLKTLKE